MYSAKILRTTSDKQIKRVYVDIAYYLNGATEPEATETKEFALDVTLLQVERYAKNEAARLEAIDTNLVALAAGTVLNFANAVESVETPEDIERNKWFRNFNRLEQLTKLQTLGALKPALVADLDTLRTTVANDFKKAYIADM